MDVREERSSDRRLSRQIVYQRGVTTPWIAAALDLLFPPSCRICDERIVADQLFCSTCHRRLTVCEDLMKHACRRCGRPGARAANAAGDQASNSGDSKSDEMSCSECKAERLEFDGCVPLWTYDGLVRQAIVSAKYGNRVALADALGNCLAGRLAMSPWIGCPDVVTAIPSHPFRRVQRGDGGSRVLAEAVAGRLKRLPSVSGTDSSYRKLSYRDLISSARRVKKQAWLGEKERRENVKGAFRLRRGLVGGVASAKPLANRHILLVDDVMTTGATASEAAKVLKLAGARQVTVAVVARAT